MDPDSVPTKKVVSQFFQFRVITAIWCVEFFQCIAYEKGFQISKKIRN